MAGDAGLAVDAQTQSHGACATVKRGRSAPGSVQPSNATPSVRVASLVLTGHPLDIVECGTLFGSGTGTTEYGEVPGDAAALGDVVGRGTGDVIGHDQEAGVDVLGSESFGRQPEVHHVARRSCR